MVPHTIAAILAILGFRFLLLIDPAISFYGAWTLGVFLGGMAWHKKSQKLLLWSGALLVFIAWTFLIPMVDIRGRPSGRLTGCKSNLKSLSIATEMFQTDHEKYPSALRELTPNYLRAIPTCPATGDQTSVALWYLGASGPFTGYNYLLTSEEYEFSCSGRKHRLAGVKEPNRPVFTKSGGFGVEDRLSRKASETP